MTKQKREREEELCVGKSFMEKGHLVQPRPTF